MGMFFNFGESVDEYDFKVINEREARASAGIMFLLGILSLFAFIMTKNLFLAEIFSITFILEFFIRVFISPNYAPYMILASIIVRNQKPDWVEAKPKQFAWVLGFLIGLVMAYFILFNILTPARMLTCVLCLVLLYLESAFGICLGCIVYSKLNIKTQKCPGGVCEVGFKKPKRLNPFVALLLVGTLFGATYYATINSRNYSGMDKEFAMEQQEDEAFLNETDEEPQEELTKKDKEALSNISKTKEQKSSDNCTPPQWAIDMGHKDMWKKHHGCE